jgi:peptidoglycan/xylan/chitin deacetylase (PgdA/CDA1 family)
MTSDELRSARLLFAPELASGRLADAELDRPEVRRAVRVRRVPSAVRRLAERIRMRQGWLSYEGDCVGAFVRARRALLGDEAGGRPRVLVRVDEFPHARAFDEPERYGRERFERFHAVLREAGVPYLLAVVPYVSHDYLDPAASGGRPLDHDETALLRRLGGEGVSFGVHGWDHRTRDAAPSRHSELCGLGADELGQRLDRARATLEEIGLGTRVLVPPFNRFDAGQYAALAARYEVVCGGPESVPLVGYHRTPLSREGAIYLPAYAPFYGRAAEMTQALERVVAERPAVWLPLVLHWGWEADEDLVALRGLAETLAPVASDWKDLLAAAR